jgi:hypothetical protein
MNTAGSVITKIFIVSIRNETIDVEIDYEATIYTKHFVRLEYKDWIIDIYAQRTNEDNCNFIRTMAIYVIKDEWILFCDEYNDYSIKETREIDEYCYRICFEKQQVDIF